jgi:hypothetical protein
MRGPTFSGHHVGVKKGGHFKEIRDDREQNQMSAPIRLIALPALGLLLTPLQAVAAENYIRSYAPSSGLASSGTPWPIIEKRVVAARPPATGPAHADYGMAEDRAAEPQGRLRLKPMNFSGM